MLHQSLVSSWRPKGQKPIRPCLDRPAFLDALCHAWVCGAWTPGTLLGLFVLKKPHLLNFYSSRSSDSPCAYLRCPTGGKDFSSITREEVTLLREQTSISLEAGSFGQEEGSSRRLARDQTLLFVKVPEMY